MTDAGHDQASAGSEAPGPRWRHSRYLIVVGILLYGGIAVYMGLGRIGEAFLAIQPAPFALMMLSLAFAMGVRALKWRLALGAGQSATALFFIAKGVGDWSPGRVGEFSPLLLKRHRTARVGAWILYDRLLEMGVTALMGLLGLALLGWVPWSAAAGVALAAVAVTAAGLWALPRTDAAGDARHDPLARVRRIARTVLREASSFGKVLPVAAPLTVVGKASDLVSVWLLFASFGERIEAPLIMATRCARAVLASLPITADQTGVPHATELGIIQQAAGIPGPTIWAALLAEVVAYSAVFWLLFAGAIWHYRQPETTA